MRLRAAPFPIIAASFAIVLTSCGGSGGSPSPSGPTAAAAVHLSIAAFFGSDPRAACDSLSTDALGKLGGRQRCLHAARGRGATGYVVDSVRFANGAAVAVVRSAGKVIQFTLVDENGHWKVSQPLPGLPGVPSSV